MYEIRPASYNGSLVGTGSKLVREQQPPTEVGDHFVFHLQYTQGVTEIEESGATVCAIGSMRSPGFLSSKSHLLQKEICSMPLGLLPFFPAPFCVTIFPHHYRREVLVQGRQPNRAVHQHEHFVAD